MWLAQIYSQMLPRFALRFAISNIFAVFYIPICHNVQVQSLLIFVLLFFKFKNPRNNVCICCYREPIFTFDWKRIISVQAEQWPDGVRITGLQGQVQDRAPSYFNWLAHLSYTSRNVPATDHSILLLSTIFIDHNLSPAILPCYHLCLLCTRIFFWYACRSRTIKALPGYRFAFTYAPVPLVYATVCE